MRTSLIKQDIHNTTQLDGKRDVDDNDDDDDEDSSISYNSNSHDNSSSRRILEYYLYDSLYDYCYNYIRSFDGCVERGVLVVSVR